MSVAHRGRWVLRAVTAFYWLTAFVLTHLPPSELPKNRIGDKYAHFITYAILSTLLYLCFWTARRSMAMSAGVVLAIGCIYGAFDELTQPLIGRLCSLNDWFANFAGVITAIGLLSLIRLIISRPHD